MLNDIFVVIALTTAIWARFPFMQFDSAIDRVEDDNVAVIEICENETGELSYYDYDLETGSFLN